MSASAGDAHPYPIYGARWRVVFPILNETGDPVDSAAGLDSEVSTNQGTIANATNEATQIGSSAGGYYLDLTHTECTGKHVYAEIKTSTSGAKTTVISAPIRRLPVIATGQAQAGAAGTITLASGASSITDYYVGCFVNPTNNSPSGVQGQARRITAYDGSTKVATVEANYGTNPSSATTYEILATEEWYWAQANVQLWKGDAPNSLVGTRLSVDVAALNSSTAAIAFLALLTGTAKTITVNSGTSTTEFETTETSDLGEAAFIDQALFAISGANAGKTVFVTGYNYNGTRVELTVSPALPATPSGTHGFLMFGGLGPSS